MAASVSPEVFFRLGSRHCVDIRTIASRFKADLINHHLQRCSVTFGRELANLPSKNVHVPANENRPLAGDYVDSVMPRSIESVKVEVSDSIPTIVWCPELNKITPHMAIFIPVAASNETELTSGSLCAFEAVCNHALHNAKFSKSRISCSVESGLLTLSLSSLTETASAEMIQLAKWFSRFLNDIKEGNSTIVEAFEDAQQAQVQVNEARAEIVRSNPSEFLLDLVVNSVYHGFSQSRTPRLGVGTKSSTWHDKAIPAASHDATTMPPPTMHTSRIPPFSVAKDFDAFRKFVTHHFDPAKFLIVVTDLTDSQSIKEIQNAFDPSEDGAKGFEIDKQQNCAFRPGMYQYRIERDEQAGRMSSHGAIVFDTSGITKSTDRKSAMRNLIALQLLQIIMGGGHNFSTGGPGKGLFSRLYTRVLPALEVDSCWAFVLDFFEGESLWGIQFAVAGPQFKGAVIEKVVKELLSMRRISSDELIRAKRFLESSIWNENQSPETFSRQMAVQFFKAQKQQQPDAIKEFEWRVDPNELTAMMNALTVEDLQSLAERITKSLSALIFLDVGCET